MSLSEIMQQYKAIKDKLATVQLQFDKFKLIFEKDFNEEIILLERQRIEKSQQDAILQVQHEQQKCAKLDKSCDAGIEVSLRELPNTSSTPPFPDPNNRSSDQNSDTKPKAKITKRKGSSDRVSPPETATAATPPNLTGTMARLYRKLCKKFHPDICGSEELFLRLQQIYEKHDNIELIEIAIDNDIDIDEYIENKETMLEYWKNEIVRIDQEIYNMTHMLPWVWCMADHERKKELRPTMIKHLRSN